MILCYQHGERSCKTSSVLLRGGKGMILTLGMGESSYLPDALIGVPQDQVDFDLIAFSQCYAHERIEWDALVFFAGYDGWCSPGALAATLAQPPGYVARTLLQLAGKGLLVESILVTGPVYRLTDDRRLRRAVIRIGADFHPLTETVL